MAYNDKKISPILKISKLSQLPQKSIVSIAGLLIIKQRPSTANGVTFLSIEDESGTANIICWEHLHKKYRGSLMIGNLLKITGHIEKNAPLVNVIAKKIVDLSYILKEIEHISSGLD
tara:strand:+ start:1777 stop:2127 length:351 start_codon:yes stop_codon:yes gene_type:complete